MRYVSLMCAPGDSFVVQCTLLQPLRFESYSCVFLSCSIRINQHLVRLLKVVIVKLRQCDVYQLLSLSPLPCQLGVLVPQSPDLAPPIRAQLLLCKPLFNIPKPIVSAQWVYVPSSALGHHVYYMEKLALLALYKATRKAIDINKYQVIVNVCQI